MPELREITTGLRFPEGPVAHGRRLGLLVEIARRALTRVLPRRPQGDRRDTGGGPNGAAIGPDGKCYVCNNGGFSGSDASTACGRRARPGTTPAAGSSGSTSRPARSRRSTAAPARGPAEGPNDIVFDAHGGFYFTDLGKRAPREMDRGAVYYAKADGSLITEVAFPMLTPNGIGLSPDGKHALRRRDRGRAALGVRHPRARRAGASSPGPRPTAAVCSPARRLPALRLAWRSRRTATSASRRWSTAGSP